MIYHPGVSASPGEQADGRAWVHAGGRVALPKGRCRVMAIVNVTPDSFFDGGRWWDGQGELGAATEAIVAQARAWVGAGAAVLDVGGESTRPGAEAVSHDDERARVVPIITALARSFPAVAISVDTRHAEVARAGLEAGATIVNDVSTLADPGMARVVAEAGAGLCISHMRGVPKTMQRDIAFDDVVAEVGDELAAAVERALAAGVTREQILVDPGVGFGKSAEQSAALVCASAALEARTGCPVLIGASRKSFLGRLLGKGASLPVSERGLPSVVAAALAAEHGAAMVRVHDVLDTCRAMDLQAAMLAARLGREEGSR